MPYREKFIRALQTKLEEVKKNELDEMRCSTEFIDCVIDLLKEQRWHVFYRDEDGRINVDCSPINQSAFLLFRKTVNDMRVEEWDDDEYYEFGCIDGVEVEEGDAWMELPDPPEDTNGET